ncbi:MAG: acetyltransferase [Rhizobiaceae bacterium]|nr:acetyltransferase [Rhizobiaceae bacterium]
MKSLLVIGASGHARVVADAAVETGYRKVGLIDDVLPAGAVSGPFEVVGRSSDLESRLPEWGEAIVGIGDNYRRLALLERLRTMGYILPTIVHPSAVVSRHAGLGVGTFVAAGSMIATGASLGEGVLVNTGATIDHDCDLGGAVHISPGAHLGGNVSVGKCTWIGIGAVVKHGVQIGADAIVGAGAVVVSDLLGGRTFVGSPARVLRNRSHR